MWYNSICHTEQITRALVFLEDAELSQFSIAGKVPSMCGPTSLAVSCDNGSACGGHFAMIIKAYKTFTPRTCGVLL